MQTDDNFNYGTIISYATDGVDNMFTLTDYNGFVLYVNGSNIVTDVNINDGLWHFICVAWTRENGFYEVHVDGSLHNTGYNLSENSFIESNGVFVIGQEQVDKIYLKWFCFVGKLNDYRTVWVPVSVNRNHSLGKLHTWIFGTGSFRHQKYWNIILRASPTMAIFTHGPISRTISKETLKSDPPCSAAHLTTLDHFFFFLISSRYYRHRFVSHASTMFIYRMATFATLETELSTTATTVINLKDL